MARHNHKELTAHELFCCGIPCLLGQFLTRIISIDSVSNEEQAAVSAVHERDRVSLVLYDIAERLKFAEESFGIDSSAIHGFRGWRDIARHAYYFTLEKRLQPFSLMQCCSFSCEGFGSSGNELYDHATQC